MRPETLPQTRGRHLNHVAWLYDPLIERMSFGIERRFRKLTLSHMDFAPTHRILDVGCGTGNLTIMVGDRLSPPGRVVGIDAAPNMIAIARKKAARLADRLRFEVGVAERLDFSADSFDLVVNSMFLHHIDHELKTLAFAEMFRVLTPGGVLVSVDVDRPSTLFARALGWGARWVLRQVELEDNLMGRLPDMMAGAGFQPVTRVAHVFGLVSIFTARKPA